MTLADHLLPRWALHRSILILVVSFAGLVASAPVSAASVHKVSGTCSGGGQLCDQVATFTHVFDGSGLDKARFSPGPLTCSNLRIHFLIDGTEVAVTGFVGPGETTSFVSLGPIAPGTHTVSVQAEGQVSGCNIGTLFSWAGTVKIRQLP